MSLTLILAIIFFSVLFFLVLVILLKINSVLNKNLAEVRGDFTQYLSSTQNTLKEVTENLTTLKSTNEQILEAGKDIQELQDILKPPKLRGGISEVFLEQLLAQVLPSNHYQTQFKFKTGNIVDAILKLQDNKLISIDAKFPLDSIKNHITSQNNLENDTPPQFIRDVKKHINDISSKYIVPLEGTLDFALMYIPAENIYYEIILKEEQIAQYAREKHVIPVSPSSLYSYLSVIMIGLKGLALEQNSKHIMQQINNLKINLSNFISEYDKLGTHLNNAKVKYDSMRETIYATSDKVKNIEMESS